MLTIRKTDISGQVAAIYEAWLIDDRDAILALAQWQRPTFSTSYTTFAHGDLLIEAFYSDRWYNIFALHDAANLPANADLHALVAHLRRQ